MTNDEAKTVFLNRGYVEVDSGTIYDPDKWREACRVISEWLEQQPCEVEAAKLQQAYNKGFEDCRQSAILLASDLKQDLPDDEHIADMVMAHNEGILEYQTQLSLLPPVTPQPKTVLYSGDGYADGYMVYDMVECPNCGYEYEDGDKDWGLSFCPNCGQKLNWESEDEE